jgi:hypothetical protein
VLPSAVTAAGIGAGEPGLEILAFCIIFFEARTGSWIYIESLGRI